MMLAIDHIACSPPDPVSFLKESLACGYQTIASARDVVNLDIKRRLLSHFAQEHDLTLMRSPTDVSIEVLDHRASSGKKGYLARLGACRFSCRTTDPEGSRWFWKRLGFCAADQMCMTFRSVLQQAALTLVMREAEDDGVPLLDDEGFNAVALLSSSAIRERESLSSEMEVTELRTLRVFGKDIELFFARNPRGGELVEVIGLPTRR